MRTWVLLREALATAWASKVPTALVALLVAVMVGATLATVGRSAAAEEQLSRRMDAAGSRLLVIRDVRARGLIGPSVVSQSGGLSIVERAVGALGAIDVVNGAIGQGGERVPAWGLVGDPADAVTLTAGRWPEPGEALVSREVQQLLGLAEPYGWVREAMGSNGAQFAVVGSFEPREPFDDYAAGVVYNAGETLADSLSVISATAGQAALTQSLVLGILAPAQIEDVQITSPVGMAELRGQVLGDLSAYGRALFLGVLAGGALLTAIVVLADVLVRRRDLGRRRALGANRAVIVALVTGRTAAPAAIGALLGAVAGAAVTARLDALPPPDFIVGVAILAVLAATASAIPPAFFAATRDPVTVLRTP